MPVGETRVVFAGPENHGERLDAFVAHADPKVSANDLKNHFVVFALVE